MFSPYRMRCPKCKTPVTIKKESYIGRKVACKECSTKFVIKPPGNKSGKSKKPQSKKVKNKSGQDSEFMIALDRLDLNDESQSIKSLPQAPGRKSKVRRVEETKARKVKDKGPKKKDAISPSVMISGVLITVLFIGGIGYLAKDKLPSLISSKVEVPKELSWFTIEGDYMSMKFPEGWEIESGGGAGGRPLFAHSQKGSISINIRESPSGNAKGDMLFTPKEVAFDEKGRPIETPESEQPIALLHKMLLIKAQDKYEGYEETGSRTIQSGMGDARVSNFKYSKFLQGEFGGIRATYRTPRFQLNLYCTCPQKDFRDTMGLFNQIAGSVKIGGVKKGE